MTGCISLTTAGSVRNYVATINRQSLVRVSADVLRGDVNKLYTILHALKY
jgi:hypothetical protein